jgi:hypothetical protein
MSELGTLLHRLDSWPYLGIERRTQRVILRVRDLAVGTLNLDTGVVSVDVPPRSESPLLGGHPQWRRTKDGVRVHVTDLDSRTAAEALLRWRIGMERFAGQLRAASP